MQRSGTLSAADLELVSAIMYADRESAPASQTLENLTRRVRDVKPHLMEDQILQQARKLLDELAAIGVGRAVWWPVPHNAPPGRNP